MTEHQQGFCFTEITLDCGFYGLVACLLLFLCTLCFVELETFYNEGHENTAESIIFTPETSLKHVKPSSGLNLTSIYDHVILIKTWLSFFVDT